MNEGFGRQEGRDWADFILLNLGLIWGQAE